MEGCRSGESADCVAVGAARADRRRLGRSPKAGLALLDQDLARNSRELIGFPNPLLYYLGDSSDRASVFGDVTAYSNDTEPCFGCPAAEGSADFADVPVRATAGQGRSARDGAALQRAFRFSSAQETKLRTALSKHRSIFAEAFAYAEDAQGDTTEVTPAREVAINR